MKRLETKLGVSLLARTSREMSLTDAGRSLLVDARFILHKTREAERSAKLAARPTGQGAPTLRLGYDESTAALLARASGTLLRSSGLRTIPTQVSQEEGQAMLAAGELDIVVGRRPVVEADGCQEAVIDEVLVATLPVEHPAVGAEFLTPSALGDDTLVLPPACYFPETYEQVQRSWRNDGVPLTEAGDEATTFSAKILLAESGQSAALVPASVATRLGATHVVHRPLLADVTMPVRLRWSDRSVTDAAEDLLTSLRTSTLTPA